MFGCKSLLKTVPIIRINSISCLSFITYGVIAYKLTSTFFAQIILLLDDFCRCFYLCALSIGAMECNCYFHNTKNNTLFPNYQIFITECFKNFNSKYFYLFRQYNQVPRLYLLLFRLMYKTFQAVRPKNPSEFFYMFRCFYSIFPFLFCLFL